MRVTILGSGTSHGVPAIGCACAVCCSPDPRDRRTRPSVAVGWQGRSILIDTAPELRQQAVRSHLQRVDAILYTHSHADHIFGLDDVRRFNEMQQVDLPVFAREAVLEDLRRAFSYVFMETQVGGGKPKLVLHPIEVDRVVGGRIDVLGLPIEVIPVLHGRLEVLAFRFGDFAYVTDVSSIPPESLERLRGVETLILDALRWEEHPTHFTIREALEVVAELKPARTWFTHMAHTVPHAETERVLPAGVRLAYDGLEIEIAGS